MEGKSFFMKVWAEFAIFNSAFHSHRLGIGIQGNYFIQISSRKQVMLAISYSVKTMAGAQAFQFRVFFYCFLHFCYRFRIIYLVGAVLNIASPIFKFFVRHPFR